MPLPLDVWAVRSKLATPESLRYLNTERFPGMTVVTASLRSPSVIVLSMIADIDPSTLVVFFRPGYLFPNSRKYRERIIELLGLANVTESKGHEYDFSAHNNEYCERMWSENRDSPRRAPQRVGQATPVKCATKASCASVA